jgi:hypothetical protein
VVTTKSYTTLQLFPDLSTGRSVLIDRIEVDYVNATALGGNFGAVGWIAGRAPPFVGSGSLAAGTTSMNPKGLSAVEPTTLVVRANNPGQEVPVSAGSVNVMLAINLISLIACDSELVIRTFYRLLPDTVITVT